MRKKLTVWVLASVACTQAPAAETTTTPPPSTAAPSVVTAAPSTSTSSTTTTTLPEISAEDVPDAAIYLAAVDAGLTGTSYEGDAYRDPDIFVATGVLFCDLLDDGLTIEEVLTGYIAALSAQSEDGEVSEDDLILGGVVLGAAIRVLCSQHVEQLTDVTSRAQMRLS